MRALTAAVLSVSLLAPLGCDPETSDTPAPPQPASNDARPAPDFAPIMKRIAADCAIEGKLAGRAKGGATLSDSESAEYWKAHNDRINALEEIVNMTNSNPRWKGALSAAFDANCREAATRMYAMQGKGTLNGLGKNPNPRPKTGKSEEHIIIATFGQWRISVGK